MIYKKNRTYSNELPNFKDLFTNLISNFEVKPQVMQKCKCGCGRETIKSEYYSLSCALNAKHDTNK